MQWIATIVGSVLLKPMTRFVEAEGPRVPDALAVIANANANNSSVCHRG